ncbi:metallophosphoesterase [Paenibacillus thiaminolyticus]|uniref:metallophosphoesterase n=1 Tax=Paenibacillus thiaminolyticus TaxID=49283 RepID=UPI0035A66AC0
MSIPLQFRPDGTFTIAQFTDLHVGGGKAELDARTLALTELIIETERPDLAVYSGDMLYGKETAEPVATLRRIVEVAERREVPFAVIFGNHDAEGGATSEELLEGIASCRMSLAEAGPADIHGVGNYVIAVKASSLEGPAALLYLFDSGDMAPASVGGYAWIRPDQVDWYRRESNRLRQRHGAFAKPVLLPHSGPRVQGDLGIRAGRGHSSGSRMLPSPEQRVLRRGAGERRYDRRLRRP